MGSEVEEGAAGIISIDRCYAGISVSLICLSCAWIPVQDSIYSAWLGSDYRTFPLSSSKAATDSAGN